VQDWRYRAFYYLGLQDHVHTGSVDRGADLVARTRTVRVVSHRHTAIEPLPLMAAAQTPPGSPERDASEQ